MRVVVNDANVLIDLVKLELLEPFFQLPFEFHVTSLVLDELYESQVEKIDPYISSGILLVHHPDEGELMEIHGSEKKPKGLTDMDFSAYIHARNLDGTLLTSDNSLRKYGKEEGIEVHGHLWVFDRMWDEGKIDGFMAARKLDELNQVVNQNLGLPQEECEKRKRRWRGEGS